MTQRSDTNSANAIALLPKSDASVDIRWWTMAKEQAALLVNTGFLPQSIKTPEQALAVMMKGKELGIPTMYALSNINVINGKPTCSAELMLALVRRDYGKDAIKVKATSNTACTVAWKEWGEVSEYTFSMDDARTAGLLGSQTWQKYPSAMLRARCISAVCRMAFPDCIAGMYTPEELGGDPADDDMPTEYTATVVTTNAISGNVVNTTTGEMVVDRATPDQFTMIADLNADLMLSRERLRELAGGKGANDLTQDEAAELIEVLQDMAFRASRIDAPIEVIDENEPIEEDF